MRIAPESISFTLLLGLFAALPALSIDLSAPTLVELPAALATTATVAGLSLTLFMLGFALGQLIGGRISDHYGRRPVMMAALAVYVLSGAACALASTGPTLAAARFVQGGSAGACAVLAFAIVQDRFEGEAARRRRSYVTVMLAIMPMLGPAIGAWLNAAFGWRSVHAVLATGGILLLGIVIALLEESRPAEPTGPSGATSPVRLREDGRFMRISLVNALSYGTLFAYIAGAPVVVMGEMKQGAAVYAGVFACTALALSAGAYASARLGERRHTASQLAASGLILQAVCALALATLWSGASNPGLALVLLAAGCFGRGLTAPNLNHLALSERHRDAGTASAAFGVVQLLGGAAASAAVAALLPRFASLAATGPMALLAAAAAVLWLCMGRRKQSQAATIAEGTGSVGR